MILDHAGWRCRIEGGVIRDLDYRGHRVLSQVAFVIRDAVWGTSVPHVEPLSVQASGESAGVESAGVEEEVGDAREAVLRGSTADPAVTWQVTVRIDDEVTIRAEARVEADCRTNRIGLVALHPRSWAGTACVLRHTDGRIEESRFPATIAPRQPFRDLGTISPVIGQGRLDITLEGEVFETEDQRNWGDASYKTYSRPLDLPAPYALAAGETITQTIRLRASGVSAARPAPTQVPTHVRGHGRPPVGCTVTSPDDLAVAARLGVDHVRVEHRLGEDRALLAAALAQPLPVHLALFLPHDRAAALGTLTAWLQRADRAPVQVHGYSEPGPLTPVTTDTDIALLSAHVPSWPGRPRLFVGTDHNLAELNRNPLTLTDEVAGIVFSFNPQVHDGSDAAIAETPGTLPDMVHTVREAYPGRAVAVAPITLRPRRSVHVEPLPRLDETLATDPRQADESTARWVEDVLGTLAHAGVDHATIFETTGPRGWVDSAVRPYPCTRAVTPRIPPRG